MINLKRVASTMILTSFLAMAGLAQASHHFESKIAKLHPAFDLTDLYVFHSERSGYTSFMMDVNPKTAKDGKAGFGSDGIYSFHIASGNGDAREHGMTITAYMEGGEFVFGLSRQGANQAVGLKGKEFGRARVGSVTTFDNGIRVWTGAARDPFVGDAVGIVRFKNKINAGKADMGQFTGKDFFAKLNSSVILMELPNKMLPKDISVFATTAFYNVDKWEQVNRMANPLITHLFMYNNKIEIMEHVGHRPDIDKGQRYVVSSNVLRAVVLQGKMKHPVVYADSVADRLLPDMLHYKVGSKAKYSFKEMNGRPPWDDAMDAVLSVFMGRAVTDNANTFDRHPKHFPYVVVVPTK